MVLSRKVPEVFVQQADDQALIRQAFVSGFLREHSKSVFDLWTLIRVSHSVEVVSLATHQTR